MFTQCSKCETVFRLSAEVLRAAGGQVRCGRCGEVFNALARLAEDGKAFTQGESSLDLETRADEILHNAAPVAAPVAPLEAVVSKHSAGGPPPGVEIAQLQIIDPLFEESDPTAESSLEFTLPPGELDRIFVESSVGVMPLQPRPVEPEIEVISDDTTSGLLEAPQRRARSFALWLSAAVAAALLLVGQVVHHERGALTAHGPLAPLLRALYEGLGAPVGDVPDLAVYQLRQWGVTGEAAGDSTLRVRASILNTTGRMQPFPLLRVTLANRFGASVGTRDFAPNEYLGKPIVRPLAPGEKVDAVLNIVDPGKEAEGFEIDVCLPGAGKRIVCANDAPT